MRSGLRQACYTGGSEGFVHEGRKLCRGNFHKEVVRCEGSPVVRLFVRSQCVVVFLCGKQCALSPEKKATMTSRKVY